MKRFFLWLGIIALLAPAGAVLGAVFGRALYRISYEYIIVVSDYTSLGLRLGLLAGTVLAASAVAGPRPPAALRRVLFVGFVVVGISLAAATALGALLALMLYTADLLSTSAWQMAFPRRHTVCLGLQYGALAGALIGTVAAAIIIAHHRRLTSDL